MKRVTETGNFSSHDFSSLATRFSHAMYSRMKKGEEESWLSPIFSFFSSSSLQTAERRKLDGETVLKIKGPKFAGGTNGSWCYFSLLFSHFPFLSFTIVFFPSFISSSLRSPLTFFLKLTRIPFSSFSSIDLKRETKKNPADSFTQTIFSPLVTHQFCTRFLPRNFLLLNHKGIWERRKKEKWGWKIQVFTWIQVQ